MGVFDKIKNALFEVEYVEVDEPPKKEKKVVKEKEKPSVEDKSEEVITSQNGIQDYINDLNKDKNTMTSVFYTESLEDRVGVKVAMQYNDGYSDNYKLYTNSYCVWWQADAVDFAYKKLDFSYGVNGTLVLESICVIFSPFYVSFPSLR